MKNDRLTFNIFEYDLQNISNDNWSGGLENILEDINMHENLILGSEVDINAAKEKLLILSDLEWQDSLCTKTKLRTYLKFKAHVETENYVSVNLKKNEHSFLAKLRSGTLPLSKEKGRYPGTSKSHYKKEFVLYAKLMQSKMKYTLQSVVMAIMQNNLLF